MTLYHCVCWWPGGTNHEAELGGGVLFRVDLQQSLALWMRDRQSVRLLGWSVAVHVSSFLDTLAQWGVCLCTLVLFIARFQPLL